MTIEPMLTNDGISLLMRAIGGEQITFTRFAVGKGAAPSHPEELADLVDPVLDFVISSKDESESGYIKLTGAFESSDVTADFQWTETGLYCKDSGNHEKLYAYCNYGPEAAIIPANDSVLTEQQVTVIVAIGEAEHVTAQVSAIYATKQEFDEHVATRNPHGTTKSDVGLGSVPNVATNDQTPTYTAPGTVTELVSGEKLSVAFGKIKAAISSLIAHLASRNNPHGVTLAQVGGAAASHTHAAGNIVSGILAIARGGTGGSTGRIVVGQHTSKGYLGTNSTAEGVNVNTEGQYGHASGSETAAVGAQSFALGSRTGAIGNNSVALGYENQAIGAGSFAGGVGIGISVWSAAAYGTSSFCFGNTSATIADGSTVFGAVCRTYGLCSFATGIGSQAYTQAMMAIGSYNRRPFSVDATSYGYSESWPLTSGNHARYELRGVNVDEGFENDLFVIGNGSYTYPTHIYSNAFRVTKTAVFGQVYNSSGADYAEMFEWADGNPNGKDRVGRFVTLDGAKLRIAGPEDDFILGIVSGNPSVCADVYDDQWQGMYLRDVYGRPVFETVYVPEVLNDKGEITVPAHTERRWKLNPDYDNDQTYVPRSVRKEWDAVGMVGKLVALDDGTCTPNGWAAVGPNGVATAAEERTPYRVMERLDERHIRVLIL